MKLKLYVLAASIMLAAGVARAQTPAPEATGPIEVTPKIENSVIEAALFPETICEAAKKAGYRCGGVPVPRVLELASNFTFARGTAELTPEAREILGKFGAVIKQRNDPTAKYRITGHTDSTGTEVINKKLSMERAAAVRNFLVKEYGVAPDAIQVEGLAATRLKRPTEPESGANRRVDFERVLAKN